MSPIYEPGAGGGGSGAPSGAAGGSLAGSYPNPTIAAGAITTTEILDGTIVNADVSASAALAASKLAPASTNGYAMKTTGGATVWEPPPVDADINGYLAWTYDIGLTTSGGTVMVAGTIYVMKVPWRVTSDISNVDVFVTAKSVTHSGNSNVAIFDASGTRLGISSDIGTALDGATNNTVVALPVTASAVPGGRQTYIWVFILYNGTTGPTLAKAIPNNQSAFNANVSGASSRSATAGTSQASMPASGFTMSTLTAAATINFWCGIR